VCLQINVLIFLLKQFAANVLFFFAIVRQAQGHKFLFSLPGAGFLVHLYQAGNTSHQIHSTIIIMAIQAL
jgi:hypothetical protein